MTKDRTWQATLTGDLDLDVELAGTPDTLRDTVKAAIAEARPLLDGVEWPDVAIVVFKTTQARGTERDRSFAIERHRNGKLHAIFMGA